MKKAFTSILLIPLFIIFDSLFSPVLAQLTQQVTLTYPIPQLSSCRDAKECYFYCEIPRHQPACQQFSRSRQLNKVLGASTSLEKLHQTALQFGITYPIQELSNCQAHFSCKSHCNLPQNQSACTLFAQKHNLIP